MYRENRGGPLIFIKIPHLGQEYTLLKGIPYMAGNRASTQGHDVISTHYVIDTSGSYIRDQRIQNLSKRVLVAFKERVSQSPQVGKGCFYGDSIKGKLD